LASIAIIFVKNIYIVIIIIYKVITLKTAAARRTKGEIRGHAVRWNEHADRTKGGYWRTSMDVKTCRARERCEVGGGAKTTDWRKGGRWMQTVSLVVNRI
jgi:hypothetical protein